MECQSMLHDEVAVRGSCPFCQQILYKQGSKMVEQLQGSKAANAAQGRSSGATEQLALSDKCTDVC